MLMVLDGFVGIGFRVGVGLFYKMWRNPGEVDVDGTICPSWYSWRLIKFIEENDAGKWWRIVDTLFRNIIN